MGSWGITVRQSDNGLDLLDTIVILVAECLYDYYQAGDFEGRHQRQISDGAWSLL